MRFEKMNELEYNVYQEGCISRYSEDLVHVGFCTAADAFSQATMQFERALPDGFYTKDTRFYIILSERDEIIGGIFTLKAQEFVEAIADFIIYDEYRGCGYGLTAIETLEKELKEEGYKAIILNVFEHNTSAKALYEKSGFVSDPKAYNDVMKQLFMVRRF